VARDERRKNAMRTGLSHIQFNVRPENVPFYRELFGFLGWETIHEGEGAIGLAGKHGESFWFIGHVKEVANDYDGPGVNHLGIGAEAQADVDTLAAWLRERGVGLLFETPRHRPEFSGGEGETYYQVMFETPDRILLEFVYTGPKDA
jgi:catechol 2,3-dioxygenase-like lactoylglutathione lyase family enzyme